MYKFNEITIDDDKGIIFLCGTKYKKESVYDKRNVLKKYIEEHYPRKNVLILEEHFVFGKREGYLSYDDIFLKNLNDIETLSAAFANGIIIIHDSIIYKYTLDEKVVCNGGSHGKERKNK